MPDRFLVITGEHGGDPWVKYVSDEKNIYTEDYDPRDRPETAARIILEIVIDCSVPEGYPKVMRHKEWPGIQAVARLDEALWGHPGPFRDVLEKVFALGMSAQMQLNRKAQEESAIVSG